MTLIRVDDMYNVSLLSWIRMGNPDIFYFDPKIYDIGNAAALLDFSGSFSECSLFKKTDQETWPARFY